MDVKVYNKTAVRANDYLLYALEVLMLFKIRIKIYQL